MKVALLLVALALFWSIIVVIKGIGKVFIYLSSASDDTEQERTERVQLIEEEELLGRWDFLNHRYIGEIEPMVILAKPERSELSEEERNFYQNLLQDTEEQSQTKQSAEETAVWEQDYQPVELDWTDADVPPVDWEVAMYPPSYDFGDSDFPMAEEEEKVIEPVLVEPDADMPPNVNEPFEVTGEVLGFESGFAHVFVHAENRRRWIRTEGEILPKNKELLLICECDGETTILLHWEEL